MENPPEQQAPKKNSNVIYFLIVVVLALLGTDVYLYLQKNKSDTRIIYQDNQKLKMQSELDSLESQVQQVTASKDKLSSEMQAKNDSLLERIKVLRVKLQKGKLTAEELVKAKYELKELRSNVAIYTASIDSLKKINTVLVVERDTLKTHLATVSDKATTLQKQNQDLSNKVQIASALKVATTSVKVFKVKNSGKEVEVTRASPAKKIKVTFTIGSNAIAIKGQHDIYLRVIDPTGNLVTQTDGGNFTSDGQQLQYNYKTSINFSDDGSSYDIEWTNPSPFQKGTYTVMLYSDGYTMGKTSFTLK